MLNRILRCFVNLRSLRLVRVELSLLSEQRTPILFDNFGRGLTQLSIDEPMWMYGTFLSLILSLPSLQTLVIFTSKQSGTPRFTLPKVPKRVLKELWIYGGGTEVATALAQCQLSFQEILIRRLPHVNPPTGGLPALLTASSEVVKKIALRDLTCGPDKNPLSSHPCSDIPPFEALRELQVQGSDFHAPPTWLANVLAAITSAPELSSIHFEFDAISGVMPEVLEWPVFDNRWVLIDRWLARLVKGRGGFPALTVTLSIPCNGEQKRLGGFLPESKAAGVEVRIARHD